MGGHVMIRTVTVGDYVSVQGAYVRSLPDGRVVVKVGEKTYAGNPIQAEVTRLVN